MTLDDQTLVCHLTREELVALTGWDLPEADYGWRFAIHRYPEAGCFYATGWTKPSGILVTVGSIDSSETDTIAALEAIGARHRTAGLRFT